MSSTAGQMPRGATIDRRFDAFPWRQDTEQFQAWCQGRTGYPMVDAGMRQLQATGWLHNRSRMVVASFLTKDLLLPWQWGARWFLSHLRDGDVANNSLGWQWVAGYGHGRCALLPGLQPGTAGPEVRPHRGLRAPVRPRTGAPAGCLGAHSVGESPTATHTAIRSAWSIMPRPGRTPSRPTR
jgi:hypothetical protein